MGVHHGWLSLVAVTSGQMVRNGAVFQPTFTELSWRSLDGSIAHLSDPTIGCTLSSSWASVVKLSALRTVVKRGTFRRLTGDGSRGLPSPALVVLQRETDQFESAVRRRSTRSSTLPVLDSPRSARWSASSAFVKPS